MEGRASGTGSGIGVHGPWNGSGTGSRAEDRTLENVVGSVENVGICFGAETLW